MPIAARFAVLICVVVVVRATGISEIQSAPPASGLNLTVETRPSRPSLSNSTNQEVRSTYMLFRPKPLAPCRTHARAHTTRRCLTGRDAQRTTCPLLQLPHNIVVIAIPGTRGQFQVLHKHGTKPPPAVPSSPAASSTRKCACFAGDGTFIHYGRVYARTHAPPLANAHEATRPAFDCSGTPKAGFMREAIVWPILVGWHCVR